MSYPNQRLLQRHKAQSDKDHPYMIVNRSALEYACQQLEAKGLRLYIILTSWEDGKRRELSPTALKNRWGLSGKEYRGAFKELEEKGFIVQSSVQKNLYDFYDDPRNKERATSPKGSMASSQEGGYPPPKGQRISKEINKKEKLVNNYSTSKKEDPCSHRIEDGYDLEESFYIEEDRPTGNTNRGAGARIDGMTAEQHKIYETRYNSMTDEEKYAFWSDVLNFESEDEGDGELPF